MLQLDYLADWPLSGAGEERRTVLASLTQDCCALTTLAGGGRVRLVDRRHRTSKLTCLTVSRQLLTVFLGTGNTSSLQISASIIKSQNTYRHNKDIIKTHHKTHKITINTLKTHHKTHKNQKTDQ